MMTDDDDSCPSLKGGVFVSLFLLQFHFTNVLLPPPYPHPISTHPSRPPLSLGGFLDLSGFERRRLHFSGVFILSRPRRPASFSVFILFYFDDGGLGPPS